jgi:dTDP-4-amino-4,6-dideoxygalactose transaminase
MYVVSSPERDRIAAALRESGIQSAPYYTTPLHLQPALSHLGYSSGDFPESERAAAENLALPLWAGISPGDQERVVEAVRRVATPVGARAT